MLPIEDEKLLQKFLQPDSKESAFEGIVRKYSRPLFVHIAKYIQYREDIEDILQIVWVKVWKNLSNFRRESLLSTWLYTISTREAYNFYRNKKNRIQKTEINEAVFAKESTWDTLESPEILEKLQSAIDTLPDKQKAVFIMRYFEEMSYEDMSIQSGTSVGALKASYHHAVKKMEEFLKVD